MIDKSRTRKPTKIGHKRKACERDCRPDELLELCRDGQPQQEHTDTNLYQGKRDQTERLRDEVQTKPFDVVFVCNVVDMFTCAESHLQYDQDHLRKHHQLMTGQLSGTTVEIKFELTAASTMM